MKNIDSVIAFAFAGLVACGSAAAVEIKVLSAGAIKPVVMAALPEFEKRTGPKVVVENDTAGGLVAQRLLTGEADLAVHQISEILAVPGSTLAGPIPAEVQNYTVYVAALATAAREPAAAQQLLLALGGPQPRAQLAAQGMEAP